MRDIQQNMFLPVKDTKTFRLIESKPCGEKKIPTCLTRKVPKRTESRTFVDTLRQKSYVIQVLRKAKFGK